MVVQITSDTFKKHKVRKIILIMRHLNEEVPVLYIDCLRILGLRPSSSLSSFLCVCVCVCVSVFVDSLYVPVSSDFNKVLFSEAYLCICYLYALLLLNLVKTITQSQYFIVRV